MPYLNYPPQDNVVSFLEEVKVEVSSSRSGVQPDLEVCKKPSKQGFTPPHRVGVPAFSVPRRSRDCTDAQRNPQSQRHVYRHWGYG